MLLSERMAAIGQRAPDTEGSVLAPRIDDLSGQALRERLHELVQLGLPLLHWRWANAQGSPPVRLVGCFDRTALQLFHGLQKCRPALVVAP